MTVQTSLSDFLTPAEIERAVALYEECRDVFADRCENEIVKPVLARVNTTLDQDNSARYLALLIELVMRQHTVKKPPAPSVRR